MNARNSRGAGTTTRDNCRTRLPSSLPSPSTVVSSFWDDCEFSCTFGPSVYAPSPTGRYMTAGGANPRNTSTPPKPSLKGTNNRTPLQTHPSRWCRKLRRGLDLPLWRPFREQFHYIIQFPGHSAPALICLPVGEKPQDQRQHPPATSRRLPVRCDL